MLWRTLGRGGGCVLLLALALVPAGALHGEPPAPQAWGTAHPLILQAVSPRGDWIVACQARHDTDGDGKIEVRAGHHGGPVGDDVQTYLLRGPGEGEAIGEFVRASPTGAHLVYVRDGSLWLHAAHDGKTTNLSALGADARDHAVPFWPHRAASFDAEGQRMTWFRLGPPDVAGLMLRDLASGLDRRIDLGPGLPVSAWFLRGDAWIQLRIVRPPAKAGQPLEFPRYSTTLDPRRCRAEPSSYSIMGRMGPKMEDCSVALSGTSARCADGVLGPMGDSLLVRREDGALLRWDSGGAEQVLVGPEHAPWVERISVTEGTALVCHTAGVTQGRWFLVSRDAARPVALSVPREASGPKPDAVDDGLLGEGTDFVREGAVEKRVDLRTGEVSVSTPQPFPEGTWLGKRYAGRKLRVRGPQTSIYDFGTKQDHALEPGVDLSQANEWQLKVNGPMRAVAGVVIDLEGLRVVGRYDGEALAVAPDGRVLVAAGEGRQGVVPGPLRWLVPTPVEPLPAEKAR